MPTTYHLNASEAQTPESARKLLEVGIPAYRGNGFTNVCPSLCARPAPTQALYAWWLSGLSICADDGVYLALRASDGMNYGFVIPASDAGKIATQIFEILARNHGVTPWIPVIHIEMDELGLPQYRGDGFADIDPKVCAHASTCAPYAWLVRSIHLCSAGDGIYLPLRASNGMNYDFIIPQQNAATIASHTFLAFHNGIERLRDNTHARKSPDTLSVLPSAAPQRGNGR